MRASILALTVVVASLLACTGTGDTTTDEAIVIPTPEPEVEAPAPAPAGSTLTGEGTAASPHVADCTTTANQLGRSSGQTDHVSCPASCTTGTVTGTGTYSGDSNVCVAAVHAGILPGAAAGTVLVTLAGPSASFTGSEANGVTSTSGTTNSDLTFTVAAATAAPAEEGKAGKGGKAGGGEGGGGGAKAGKGGKGGKNR